MVENTVTRDEFNGAISGLRADVNKIDSKVDGLSVSLSKTNESLVRLETQREEDKRNLEIVVSAAIRETTDDIRNSQEEGKRFTWGQVIIPICLALMTAYAALKTAGVI